MKIADLPTSSTEMRLVSSEEIPSARNGNAALYHELLPTRPSAFESPYSVPDVAVKIRYPVTRGLGTHDLL